MTQTAYINKHVLPYQIGEALKKTRLYQFNICMHADNLDKLHQYISLYIILSVCSILPQRCGGYMVDLSTDVFTIKTYIKAQEMHHTYCYEVVSTV
jgi:hypothetical protein